MSAEIASAVSGPTGLSLKSVGGAKGERNAKSATDVRRKRFGRVKVQQESYRGLISLTSLMSPAYTDRAVSVQHSARTPYDVLT